MGRWDVELLENDFCDFAKKIRMGSRDGELLELLLATPSKQSLTRHVKGLFN
jgi:hypothetical protein